MPIKVTLKGTGSTEPWTVELEVASGLASRLAAGTPIPSAPLEEKDLAPDPVDGATKAEVVVSWRRGDLDLPSLPAGAHLEDDGDSAFVRLVWPSVVLDMASAPAGYTLGWTAQLEDVSVASGAGHQLVSAWFGPPGTSLDTARGHDAVQLPAGGPRLPLWLRVLRSLFGFGD